MTELTGEIMKQYAAAIWETEVNGKCIWNVYQHYLSSFRVSTQTSAWLHLINQRLDLSFQPPPTCALRSLHLRPGGHVPNIPGELWWLRAPLMERSRWLCHFGWHGYWQAGVDQRRSELRVQVDWAHSRKTRAEPSSILFTEKSLALTAAWGIHV